MRYKQLTNEQKFGLCLAQTMFQKGKWCGISDMKTWVELSKQNPWSSKENFEKMIAYLQEKSNFHYNQWQSDFKPDKGLCPNNQALEIMRQEEILSVQSLKNAMYGE